LLPVNSRFQEKKNGEIANYNIRDRASECVTSSPRTTWWWQS